jgi:hypothetical protein
MFGEIKTRDDANRASTSNQYLQLAHIILDFECLRSVTCSTLQINRLTLPVGMAQAGKSRCYLRLIDQMFWRMRPS